MPPKHAIRKACCVGLLLLVSTALPMTAYATSLETITEETARRLVETMRLSATVGRATLLEFLPEDRLLVAAEYGAVVWDLASGEIRQRLDRSVGIGWVLDVSSDGSRIAVRSAGHTLEIWDLDTLERMVELCPFPGARTPHVVFSPDDRLVAFFSNIHDIEIWEIETRTRLHFIEGEHWSNTFSLVFSPDGLCLATASGCSGGEREDSFIKIWTVETGELTATLRTPEIGDNHQIAFSPDGATLATSGNFDYQIWETGTWERIYRTPGGYSGSYGLAFSPDGALLAFGGDANRAVIWTADTHSPKKLMRYTANVSRVTFSPDGTRFACAVADSTIRLWEVEPADE